MNVYDLPIQGYQGKEPHYARPSYHGRHTLMQVQATRGRLKASPRAFPRVVVFTTGREVAREDEPNWTALGELLPRHHEPHHGPWSSPLAIDFWIDEWVEGRFARNDTIKKNEGGGGEEECESLPRVVVFTIGHEVVVKVSPTWASLRELLPSHHGPHHLGSDGGREG
ncbi:hypothetical protein H5410_046165 [Solanum commersonii]|uniref:Uncharacterized protein n=1 Tax=Solanum commersonii TaxID=4109 RepID=A0A9J5XBI2_SOLCO|nr:hypothetical protein H5410_046165 [Solanum commersonii]